jgi:hypothetical protein
MPVVRPKVVFKSRSGAETMTNSTPQASPHATATSAFSADPKNAEHYRAALVDITALSRSGFAELASTAHMLLLAMESPNFYRDPDHLSTLLDTMYCKATRTVNAVGCEAERVACWQADEANIRRSAAYAASRKPWVLEAT